MTEVTFVTEGFDKFKASVIDTLHEDYARRDARIAELNEKIKDLQNNIDRRVAEANAMVAEIHELKSANVRYHTRTVEMADEIDRLRAEASVRLQITEVQANRIEDLDKLTVQQGVDLEEVRRYNEAGRGSEIRLRTALKDAQTQIVLLTGDRDAWQRDVVELKFNLVWYRYTTFIFGLWAIMSIVIILFLI